MASSQTPKKKCRQYNEEYLNLGFVPSPTNQQLPMCLLCNKTLQNDSMKPFTLRAHLTNMHPNYADKDLAYFQDLKEQLNSKSIMNMFQSPSTVKQTVTDGLRASYNLSYLIAKSGKPHSIGEKLILPAVTEVLKTVMHHKCPEQITKSISLSNDTVRRRVDEMAINMEETLCTKLKTTEFSLQIDESTMPNNESLLLGYVRYVDNGSCVEELLFARKLVTNKTGLAIFRVVEGFFKEKDIPLTNIIACATDGEPAMVGCHRGFLSFLKEAVPGIFTVHCVIHRQHLIAKDMSYYLHNTLNIVIKSVNKIKAHALNSRLFSQLCKENNEDYKCLVLHTEVRWLSKGNCLKRFYNLFNSAVDFLHGIKSDLGKELKEMKHDVAYLADIFEVYNIKNKQLQGDKMNLITAKTLICTFMAELRFFKFWMDNRSFKGRKQFPNLSAADDEKPITDLSLQVYCDHLDKMHFDMTTRFGDLINLCIPTWVSQPLLNTEYKGLGIVEEELIYLKNDFELHPMLSVSCQAFWLQNGISERYPALYNIVKKFYIAFPTSYLVERGFSAVAQLLGKQRQKLCITKRGDLRVFLSNIKPDIEKLVSAHQAHPSHGKPARAK